LIVRLALWSLADSPATVEELRTGGFTRSPGAVSEVWFSDEATERLGVFSVFANREAAAGPVPERLRELTAKEPDLVELFDLEAQP